MSPFETAQVGLTFLWPESLQELDGSAYWSSAKPVKPGSFGRHNNDDLQSPRFLGGLRRDFSCLKCFVFSRRFAAHPTLLIARTAIVPATMRGQPRTARRWPACAWPTASRGRCGRWPGIDRFAGEEPPKLVGKFVCSLVALTWVLFQALQPDRLQVALDIGVQLPRAGRFVVDHLVNQHPRVAAKREFARQQLKQDDAQRIHVAAAVGGVGFAVGLLGGHVGRRAEDVAVDRHA